MWSYQLTKLDFSDLGYFSGHVLPKKEIGDPHAFFPFWQK